jgi:hypothetical protein
MHEGYRNVSPTGFNKTPEFYVDASAAGPGDIVNADFDDHIAKERLGQCPTLQLYLLRPSDN